ncbi:glycosyltransferase [Marinobacter daepoensis]|uniref:glycosyltransferase n=1 Tax=Marinobacter daepoensis TaxID=262077 RepID=UPI001C9580E0|nr:glycosyltransferase [Marinobacter daepoensis]MBY6033623.1 glycosyltransferase [Marinobacter daepoensis]
MQETQTILCIHQGAELYGSDRSFLSAVQALAESGLDVKAILPADGGLADELRKIPGLRLGFFDRGILRKRALRNPLAFMWGLVSGVLFYMGRFADHKIIYINTVVMFSALVAACVYRFSSRRIICHVREIPGRRQVMVFRALFRISGVELIYNSNATREAFNLPGRVIYNGVSAPVSLLPQICPSEGEGALRLLVIGRINHWKGQDFFVESLGALSSDYLERLDVRIVGSPFEGYEYLLDNLTARIETLGLQNTISLIPFCSDPSAHFQWADYVVVPSTEPEPFGRVAIEAFAFGKPVIAAAHGGLPEIVEPGASGLLFEPVSVPSLADALIIALEMSSDDYAEMKQNALKRFEHKFSLAGYKANIRDFFFD